MKAPTLKRMQGRFALSLLLLLMATVAYSGNVNGPIRATAQDFDGTIGPNATLYIPTSMVVPAGASLLIKEGCTIIFQNSSSQLIVEEGAELDVLGTEYNPVVFRSSSSTKGSWQGIIFEGDPDEDNYFSHTQIKDAVVGLVAQCHFDLYYVEIENCNYAIKRTDVGLSTGIGSASFLDIHDCDYGIHLTNHDDLLLFTNVTISDITYDALWFSSCSSYVFGIDQLEITNCGNRGLYATNCTNASLGLSSTDISTCEVNGSTVYISSSYVSYMKDNRIFDNDGRGMQIYNSTTVNSSTSSNYHNWICNNQQEPIYSNPAEILIGYNSLFPLGGHHYNIFNDDLTMTSTLPRMLHITSALDQDATNVYWGDNAGMDTWQEVKSHCYYPNCSLTVYPLANGPFDNISEYPGKNSGDQVGSELDQAYALLRSTENKSVNALAAVDQFTRLIEGGSTLAVDGLVTAMLATGESVEAVDAALAGLVNESNAAQKAIIELAKGKVRWSASRLDEAIEEYQAVAESDTDQETRLVAQLLANEVRQEQVFRTEFASFEEQHQEIVQLEQDHENLLRQLDGIADNEADRIAGTLPQNYSLDQAYPNPFNPSVTIPFTLPGNSHVKLTVHNTLGQLVATLVDGSRSAGQHQAVWNGHDANGGALSSGVYFVRMETPGYSKNMKVVMTK